MTDLFSPITLGPNQLPNRIVMAPLTRCRADRQGVLGEMTVTYYAQRASAGLIISEACAISPQGLGYAGTPGIYTDEQIAAWRRITDAVHAKGGHMFLQLWHVGRISHPSLQPDGALPVAPSAIKPEGNAATYEGFVPFVTPRALEADEIPAIVADYRRAAENALKAGFDGVEVHAANGYLIDQFLRDGSNRRTDQYGGSIENRIRFLQDVIAAVTEVCGAERTGVRLSPTNSFNDMSDSNPQSLFNVIMDTLNPMRLAYVHVVEGVIHATGGGEGFDFDALAKRCNLPYMANNTYDKARGMAAIQHGHADMVSYGALFIANPDLPRRFAEDAALNEPNVDTFYMGGEKGYIDYPALG